jgi:hypothetical protein
LRFPTAAAGRYSAAATAAGTGIMATLIGTLGNDRLVGTELFDILSGDTDGTLTAGRRRQ